MINNTYKNSLVYERVGEMEIRRLNTIRGLAAAIVFFTHFSDVTGWIGGIVGGKAGQYGVMLFFLLSGFLMSHLNMQKDINRKNITLYALARSGRVLPLYVVVVIFSYFFSLLDIDWLYKIPNEQALAAHLLFIYGDSVLWTVAVDIQFYFIFAGLWILFSKKTGYIYVTAVGILIFLFFTNFSRLHGDIYGIPYHLRVLKSLPYFLVGVILGLHYNTLTIPRYLKKHAFVLSLLLIPLMYPSFSPVESDAKIRMWLSYEVLIVMSAVFFSVVFLVPEKNIILENPLGDFLGKISYSLYLLHLPIISLVDKMNFLIEVKLVVSIILSIAIAYFVYRFFERPMITRFKKGLSR